MKIPAQTSILGANDRQAQANRRRLEASRLLGVNVLASPGAGKTSMLKQVLGALRGRYALGVIEGDVASSIDTDALRALGFAATQINTDGGCHLEAVMVAKALDALAMEGPGFVFVENIGNLICPVSYQLGESLRVVVASVPEGHDKPLKYPGVFQCADAIVLNKIDLLELVDFDRAAFERSVRAASPDAPIFELSCRTGQGAPALVDWLVARLPWRI
jgi:hydrogenase nickel incorporation protein HypB